MMRCDAPRRCARVRSDRPSPARAATRTPSTASGSSCSWPRWWLCVEWPSPISSTTPHRRESSRFEGGEARDGGTPTLIPGTTRSWEACCIRRASGYCWASLWLQTVRCARRCAPAGDVSRVRRAVHERQEFNITRPVVVRFVKFRVLSHYGDEHWCTLTSVHVYGSVPLVCVLVTTCAAAAAAAACTRDQLRRARTQSRRKELWRWKWKRQGEPGCPLRTRSAVPTLGMCVCVQAGNGDRPQRGRAGAGRAAGREGGGFGCGGLGTCG
jgi:hypothetical protein